MAKSKRVSLYLGSNSIGGVVVDNRKIVKAVKFDFSALEEEAKVESLTEEVKWEALINRTMRELGAVNEKEVYVSLADKDFIFRMLDLPLMNSRRETTSALTYEIEKYIPFKLEELKWDYQNNNYVKEKRSSVAFVALKKDNYKKVEEMLTCLNVKPIVIEPAAVSLARCLKLSRKFSGLKNFAVLDYNEFEAYLTFFSDGLPIFSRYFPVPRKEGVIDTDKLFEPLQFSFQYFHREFKIGPLEKLVIISDLIQDNLVSLIKDELQMSVDAVGSSYFSDKSSVCLENIKALGAANHDISGYKFQPELLTTIEHASKKQMDFDLLQGLRLGMIIGAAVLCAVLVFGVSTVFEQQLSQKQAQLQAQKSSLQVPAQLKQSDLNDLASIIAKDSKKLAALEKIVSQTKEITPLLKTIGEFEPRGSRPKGIWFTDLEISINSGTDYKSSAMVIHGLAFLRDAYSERRAVDNFVESLKQSDEVKAVFSAVELTGSTRKTIEEYEVTEFSIQLRR